jgi:hypothetical protein
MLCDKGTLLKYFYLAVETMQWGPVQALARASV